MANKYKQTAGVGWQETGCGCSGSKPQGAALPGINNSLLLVWVMPIPSVVIGPDNSKYQTQGQMILLDMTEDAYYLFRIDPRFRVPSEAEKLSMFGYKGRIL